MSTWILKVLNEAWQRDRGSVSAEHAITMAIIAVVIATAVGGLINAIAGVFITATGMFN
ncbi:MAG: hypothetical protein ACR2P0_17475 [Acidimicrobiales bacterium]